MVKRYLGPDAPVRYGREVRRPCRGSGVGHWIVRMHYPHIWPGADALTRAMGTVPWRRRQNAVLNKCRWALDFATSLAESNATLVAIREQRLEATATFRE